MLVKLHFKYPFRWVNQQGQYCVDGRIFAPQPHAAIHSYLNKCALAPSALHFPVTPCCFLLYSPDLVGARVHIQCNTLAQFCRKMSTSILTDFNERFFVQSDHLVLPRCNCPIHTVSFSSIPRPPHFICSRINIRSIRGYS
jgi:hypothetical protein